MADRIPTSRTKGHTAKESDPSDISEPEKKSKEKETGESKKTGKTPRVKQLERSIEDHSDESTGTMTTGKSKRGVGEKIKQTWQNVQEKLAGSSRHVNQAKISSSTQTNSSRATSPTEKQVKEWKTSAQALLDNAKTLRSDFVISKKTIDYGSSDGLIDPTSDFSALSSCTGLGFPFDAVTWTEENIRTLQVFGTKSFSEKKSTSETQKSFLADDGDAGDLKKYNLHKPVKLLAGGIGKDRFAEVLKALQEIPSHCPVILDLSWSDIGPAELNQLVDIMETCPVIYHLDLRNNTLCEGDEPSPALIRLFENLGPMSHLYLEQTGLNDNTAVGIHDALQHNRCLRYLDLQNNRLTDKGVITVVDAAVPWVKEPFSPDDFVLSEVKLENNPYAYSKGVNNAFYTAATRCVISEEDDSLIIRPMPFDLFVIEPPWNSLQNFAWNIVLSQLARRKEEDFQRL